MALPTQITETYKAILREELLVAMGCTEPISIAYAAAILTDTLGGQPSHIEVLLSGGIIKNAKSVIVPKTGGLHGIKAAVAAGVVAAAPEKQLEVLEGLCGADADKIKTYLENCPMRICELQSEHPFDLRLEGVYQSHRAEVHIQKNHTGVKRVTLDGNDCTAKYQSSETEAETVCADRSLLNVADIVAFADEADLTDIAPLLNRQAEMNMQIANEGLRGDYGASIGKVLYQTENASLHDRARAFAAAGSDARMSGCELPVSILSGSGNQGIAASVPVVVYAEAMGVSHEKMLRALLVSDLITIHQKTGIGCLSAYCGAISAGCGCGTGICYLNGGKFHEIAHTLVNSVAILSGTICDGAKPSCAAKIAMAVQAGILGYEMMCAGKEFYGGDGIVTKGVENTIRNVGKLARDGMGGTDKEIIRIMLE